MKKLFAILLACTMLLSLAACSGSNNASTDTAQTSNSTTPAETTAPETSTDASASDNTIKLGAFLGLTGTTGYAGIEADNGIKLALSQLGDWAGMQVQYVTYDTTCSAEEAVKVASKLINDEKVDIAIGSITSGEVLAAGQYFNEAGIPLVGCGTSATWMEQDWPYVYRATKNDSLGVSVMVQALEQLNFETAAVFHGQDDAANSTAEKFVEECEARGISIVANESYDSGDTDYSAQLAKIAAAEPDVLYMALIGNDSGSGLKQIRNAGYDGIVLSKECFQAYMIEVAGVQESNYVVFPEPYVCYTDIEDCTDETMKAFLTAYQEAYGQLPETTSAYRGYDACLALYHAVTTAGSKDHEAINNAFSQVTFEGLGGTIDFTQGREGLANFGCFVVIDSKYVPLDSWIADGGYDNFLAETGRSK